MALELSKYTPTKIPYKPPVNWALITTAVSGVFAFLLALRFIIPILASRWIWALLITVACVIFTSGIMFVRIRSSPWVGSGKNGPSWIAGGYQNMYGVEVQGIAGICEYLRRMSGHYLTTNRWNARVLVLCINLPCPSHPLAVQATTGSLHLVHCHLPHVLRPAISIWSQEPGYVT